MDIVDYSEHAIGHGSDVQAAAYVECRTEDGRIAAALTSQAFYGRTFATSGAVDAAIEKMTTADVNAALRWPAPGRVTLDGFYARVAGAQIQPLMTLLERSCAVSETSSPREAASSGS